jgi:drug/metabolite transporter (DMT)-like permease
LWYNFPVQTQHIAEGDEPLTSPREHALGVLYLFLTALCWGFVASTVKRLTEEVDPYTISFFRVALATVVFAIVVRRAGWSGLRKFLPWIVVGAVGRAGNYLLYNAGLTWMPSNAATILAPVQAIATVVLARWFLAERARGKAWGLVLSVAGLLLIWWSGEGWEVLRDPRYLGGNALLILAGLASALQFTSQKALSSRLSGPQILLPVFALSTVITVPFAAAAGGFSHGYAPTTWLLILVLGFVLTGGSFYLLGEGYRRCDASTAVVVTNTSAFFTLLWSALLLGERVSIVMIVGAVLSVAGTVHVVNAGQRRARVAPEDAAPGDAVA